MTPATDELTAIIVAQRWRCQIDPVATRECVVAAVRSWPVMQETGRLAERTEEDITGNICYQVSSDGKRRNRIWLEFILRVLASLVAHLLIIVIFASDDGRALLTKARGENP